MTTLNEIAKFLKEKNQIYRENETHYQLDCFICTDTRARLGINKESGAWNCFNCHSNGKKHSSMVYAFNHRDNIKSKDTIEPSQVEKKCRINSKLHLRFYKSILKTKTNGVAKYLTKERKISREAIKHFKLGHRSIFKNKDKEEYDAGEHLAIPYLVGGKCVCLKYRSLDPQVDKKFKWRREVGGISALFNDSAIDNLDDKSIYIAESELDCISLWELGIKNVIGLTTGAEAFSQTWYERLTRFEKIYLVLDNDIPGQDGAKKLAKRLGMGRCYNIVLPDDVKDPNDFLRKYDLQKFKRLAAKAKQFEVKDALSLRTVMDDIYRKRFIDNNVEVLGYTTPWKKVNRISGSMKEGHLVVVSGKPKSGKTTLAMNLMEYWGSKKINTGMYSCEMRVDRLGEKFTQMKIPNLPDIELVTPLQIREASLKLPIDHMHFYYPQPGDLELEKVCQKIKDMVQRYGIKIFVFDNLHFLCRGEGEKEKVDMATQAFKLLAESLDIVFILVTHPRKTNHNKQLKTDDLKGSGSIFQDADLVWLMHRPFNDGDMTPDEVKEGSADDSMSQRAEMSITGRWTAGGKTFLAFNGARSLFKDHGVLYKELANELGKKRGRRRKGI